LKLERNSITARIKEVFIVHQERELKDYIFAKIEKMGKKVGSRSSRSGNDIVLSEGSSELMETNEMHRESNNDVEMTKQSEELSKEENASCCISDEEDAASDTNEEWDLKQILSIAAVTHQCPIKCSHDTCTLAAATVWVSNLKPSENWYSCLDCQVRHLCNSNSLLILMTMKIVTN
jgi:hypothetical protein